MLSKDVFFICPACKRPLVREAGVLLCTGCGKAYPVEFGIADFAEGEYYDNFTGEENALTAEHRAGLALEEAGSRWRIERFYAALVPSAARVLDCGCGNGVSVDTLLSLGHDAWGIDLSALRKWQWRERAHPERLGVASALNLPFDRNVFDIVISSGVIEHIGVAEVGGGSYSVRPLPNRDELRALYVSELLRVTRPGGRIYIDCPNGLFPIDFWHSSVAGRGRWHSPSEGFLPSFADIKGLVDKSDRRATVRLLSARDRFAFRQVGRHWYGRLLRGPAAIYIRLLGLPVLRKLAQRLTPYLVVEITIG